MIILNTMNPNQDFNRLYSDVSKSIAVAMTEISDIKVEHKDGKQELNNMMQRLQGIQARFDGELSLLEEHAEWDKFTMAFFGETNAGKSTIIESLRILFKEESRQQLLQQNSQDLKKFEQALTVNVNNVREGLKKVYEEFSSEIVEIRQNTVALNLVLQEETSSRIKRKLLLASIGSGALGAAAAGMIVRLMGA